MDDDLIGIRQQVRSSHRAVVDATAARCFASRSEGRPDDGVAELRELSAMSWAMRGSLPKQVHGGSRRSGRHHRFRI